MPYSELYQSWLEKYCSEHPEIISTKIVFDNQNLVLTYEQPLPDIDETVCKTNCTSLTSLSFCRFFKNLFLNV